MSSPDQSHSTHTRSASWALTIGALGVVFGDIGTSPLYALRECFSGAHALSVTPDHVFGSLSLIFWSLVVVVSIKYLTLALRLHNKGEGGAMAQLALLHRLRPSSSFPYRQLFVYCGLFGAAVIYGDGAITPAISIVSAIEGLRIIRPELSELIIPISLGIITALFLVQSRGTHRLGAFFGPIILVWFVTIGLLGILGIARNPEILQALNPLHLLTFMYEQRREALTILSAVFLAVTGAEALYADMGHFGASPIRRAWFWLVFPALTLNYFGQGALVLLDPQAIQHPFFLLAPDAFRTPLVVLATLATVIASQALISGAFSITHQAVQLGFLPRLEIRHTSERAIGQVYVPLINWLLFGAVIWLVLTFKTSEHLAHAYGAAISTTMVLTTVVMLYLARTLWHWSLWAVIPLVIILGIIDMAYFIANISKILSGGWFPLALGALVFLAMSTWYRGRFILADRLRATLVPPGRFIAQIASAIPQRLPGTAIFMSRTAGVIPTALFHNVKHNQALHERILLVSVMTEDVPHVPDEARIELDPLGSGFFAITVHYGFSDTPNIPDALRGLEQHGIEIHPTATTYFLSRETIVATPLAGMAIWRERLFAFMSRNAERAGNYYQIPSGQIVEIGVQVEI